MTNNSIKTLQFDFANPKKELMVNFREFFVWLLWTDCEAEDAIEELTGFLLAIRSLENNIDVTDFCEHALMALFSLSTDFDTASDEWRRRFRPPSAKPLSTIEDKALEELSETSTVVDKTSVHAEPKFSPEVAERMAKIWAENDELEAKEMAEYDRGLEKLAQNISDVLRDENLPDPLYSQFKEALASFFNQDIDQSEIETLENSQFYIRELLQGYKLKQADA